MDSFCAVCDDVLCERGALCRDGSKQERATLFSRHIHINDVAIVDCFHYDVHLTLTVAAAAVAERVSGR